MSIPEYERYLQENVLPELSKGRVGWDRPHTEKVVSYVKRIIENNSELGLDLDVLVTVGYLHDYGYMYFKEYLKPGPTSASGMAKQMHAKKSAEYWVNIQDNEVFVYFTQAQKDRITHLIEVHDELDKLTDTDELIFMEADTLGAIAMGNFQKIDKVVYGQYVARVQKLRIPKFITAFSREESNKILEKLVN